MFDDFIEREEVEVLLTDSDGGCDHSVDFVGGGVPPDFHRDHLLVGEHDLQVYQRKVALGNKEKYVRNKN